MAEMLVDGAKLDACNTAEADAIRAKTGGLSPIPYDFANNKGFADAIAAIPSGGGEKVYTKLGEAVVSEPVNSLNISFTEQMRNCEVLYLVVDSVVLSASDWVYPNINNSPNFSYFDKSSTVDAATVVFSPIKKTSGSYKTMSASTSYNRTTAAIVISTFNTIGIKCYTDGINITSGKIEVWGYV